MSSAFKRLGTVVMAATFSVGATARAAQWSGGGLTSNWTNANNWIGFDRPDDDGTDWVTFYSDTARDVSTVNQSYWIQGVYFGTTFGDSTSNTIDSSNGSILTMEWGVESESPDAQTINVPIRANSSITIENGGISDTYGGLTFNGQLDTNGMRITLEPSSGNITMNGPIIGAGGLLVRGAGTVQLTAANSFNGGIQVENGTLQFAAGSSLGSTSNFIRLEQAGTSNPPTLLRTTTGTVSIPLFLITGECRLAVPAGVTATYSAGLRGYTAADLVKTGAGTVVLGGAAGLIFGQDAPYDETKVNQGTLHLAASYALSGRGITVSGGATLSTAANTLQVAGQLNGSGNLSLGAGSTLYVGNGTSITTNGSGTFAGAISGTDVVLRKQASGTLSLRGTSNYSGTTLITAGVLSADNTGANTSATGTSSINVQAGAILAGDGRVAGSVTLYEGAFLSPSSVSTPGSGIGSLATGPLALEAGSAALIEFDGAQCDLISVTGDAIISGRLALSGENANFSSLNGRRILSTTGMRTGIFNRVDGLSISPAQSLAVTYGIDGVFLTLASPGDATLDGNINFDDLLTLAQNYGSSSVQTWSLGDFTGDAATNFDDLLILMQSYGPNFAVDWVLAQGMVPEPTAMLAIVATLAALRRRR